MMFTTTYTLKYSGLVSKDYRGAALHDRFSRKNYLKKSCILSPLFTVSL